ncbi:MAG: molybdate ABC transporter substrate-binding protein [Methanoregulaceae archaeon]
MSKKISYSILSVFAVCSVLLLVIAAGCTGTTSTQKTTATPVATTAQPVATASPVTATQEPTVVATAVPAVEATATTSGSSPSGYVIAYTAASLSGASKVITPAFHKEYPQAFVTFNLAGTQTIKHQVESGAYADVFISASSSYTNSLKNEGYFVNDTVKELTTNYVILILPANNPGKITSLADLATPGKKIAIGTSEVPIGIVTRGVLDKLGNSTYNASWEQAVYNNVVTYETAEPSIATKVALGQVDAGFVYESTYKAAKNGTLTAIDIPKEQNVLQKYQIAVMRLSTNKDAAQAFENYMLSADGGQKILSDFGFRPVS